jgi:hypothetical protein
MGSDGRHDYRKGQILKILRLVKLNRQGSCATETPLTRSACLETQFTPREQSRWFTPATPTTGQSGLAFITLGQCSSLLRDSDDSPALPLESERTDPRQSPWVLALSFNRFLRTARRMSLGGYFQLDSGSHFAKNPLCWAALGT